MSTKKARSPQDAEKLLQKRPVLALFYMEGCPHCASNRPAWEEAKKRVRKEAPETKIVEIEAEDVPASAGVRSFPTIVYRSKGGDNTKVEGSHSSAEDLLQNVGWKQNPLKNAEPEWKQNSLKNAEPEWKQNPLKNATRKAGRRKKNRKTRRRY